MAPEVAAIPDEVYRIGRTSDLLRFSRIRPDDAELKKGGNRYDVPGGAVLYVATQVRACFGETLARYRPTPRMREVVADEEARFMVCGGVPRDWRLQRSIATISTSEALPFLDVDSAATQAFLSRELAGELLALGYDDNLDLADVCNDDRRLSRAIARYAYNAIDDSGTGEGFLYSGVKYRSRIDPGWECWAIFDGTDVYETSRRAIELSDDDLRSVADMWELRPF